MAEILHQLSTRVPGLPLSVTDDTQTQWVFSGLISAKHATFYDTLSINRSLLAAQYRVQCAQIISIFKRSGPKDIPALLRITESTLVLAELLEHVYRRLEETDDINRLQVDKACLRALLSEPYLQFKNMPIFVASRVPGYSLRMRRVVTNTTQPRLMLTRLRRTILATFMLESFAVSRPWITAIERVTAPFFAHLAWVFFVPRLSINLVFLTKHLFPHPWMSVDEYALPWRTRLSTYLNMHRHVFELLNDAGWFLAGALSCFSCTGIWFPARAYIAVSMQLLEFLITYIRSTIEINRLRTLEQEFSAGCANGTLTVDVNYHTALKMRIMHEYRSYALELSRNVLLNISILTILPILATLHPIIPIMGAILSVITTIGVVLWDTSNFKQRPLDGLADALAPREAASTQDIVRYLTQHNMFQSTASKVEPAALDERSQKCI